MSEGKLHRAAEREENMKIAIVGANGNLGSRLTRQALKRGHEVLAVLYDGETPDDRAAVLRKSLLDMSGKDLEKVDVMISAFGGGFQATPSINKEAFQKYRELAEQTGIRVIAIGGAGSLFTDGTHTVYEYETEGHPDILKEISKNIRLGINELEKSENRKWTVVCPSRTFDPQGDFSGDYLIGTKGEIIYNQDGASYVTYEDMAGAMLDIAETGKYEGMLISVATARGGKTA